MEIRKNSINRRKAINKRRQLIRRRRLLIRLGLGCFVIITWIMVFLFAGKNVSQANDVNELSVHNKYYKTITVKPNDTLWDIALANKTDEYDSTKDYVREIQLINGIEDDEINSGEKLIIPYYE